MTRTIIGQKNTDENGHASIEFDLDFIDDFTIEAEYTDQEIGINVSDSQTVENITYELTLNAEETEIDTGDPLEISGELTSSDGTVITDEIINIFANNQKIKTITIIDGEYSDTIDNLGDGGYTIYAGFKNDRVVSESINVTIGTPQLTLTAEKQYINTTTESNSLILTGYYGIGNKPMAEEEINIYDGSTLIDTQITNENGGFEIALSGIDDYMHLYKATCEEKESEIFEVYIGHGDEVVIETTSNTITFGYSENYPWMITNGNVNIYFGDGTSETVNNPVNKLTHTFNDNKQKHMIVLYGSNSAIEALGYEFLRGNTGVTSVITGSNPYAISDKAFYGCTGLQSIFIPYTLDYTIGESAFEGCTSLQTVTIEGNMNFIKNKAFYGCTSINEYKLLWKGLENIIAYDSNIFQTNLLTKFTVPAGQKNNFIVKGYPADRIEEGQVELTITADKTEYNMDENVIVTITLKENGLPLIDESITAILSSDILDYSYTTSWRTNINGQVIKELNRFGELTCGGDIDIKVTYENVTNVLNIDGYIYKNSLQEQDPDNWIVKGSPDIYYYINGLQLIGRGDGALILNKKLFKYVFGNITIEYDLIYGSNGYSYLNYFFDENLEDKVFQLAKKPYGVQGTILDEYPNSDNWIDTIIQRYDHIKIRIDYTKVELFINGYLILTKNNYYYWDFENKLFSFATVKGSGATYKNLKIAYEENYDINLTADKTIIESGETATITATIGDPVVKPNKKLHYQVKNGTTLMYEGDIISNSNGQASITYTGTGAGDVDIIFTYFDIEKKISIEDGTGKTQTIITLTNPTEDGLYYSDETININGVLTDKNGNPLANKQIKIENYEVQ